MKKPATTVYAGSAATRAVTVDGLPLDPRPSQDLCNHSPDGFEWGYGGSGPAQLALAMLLDYYGDGALAERHYMDFKWLAVASLSQFEDWKITGTQIEGHISEIVRADAAVESFQTHTGGSGDGPAPEARRV